MVSNTLFLGVLASLATGLTVSASHNTPLHQRKHVIHPAPAHRDFPDSVNYLGRRAAGAGADPNLCRPRTSTSTSTTSTRTSFSSTTSITSSMTPSSITSPAITTSSSTWSGNNDYAQATTLTTASAVQVSVGVSVGATSSSGANAWTIPNGIKAGISGGDAFDYVSAHIGWWYDWTPDPSGHSGNPIAVPMLWGAGTANSEDATRLAKFEALNYNPTWIIGFEEPDCPAGAGSAGIDVGTAAAIWNEWVAPHGWGGSLLLSPSMCHQAAESGWLQPFAQQISKPWDITNIHINKNSAAGIQADIDHYWNTYGKPIWVTEFACVDDSTGFVPCEDQGEINSFIQTAVAIFEADYRVVAYAYSNGAGLGNNWPMINSAGQFSASGQAYLSAISQYH